MQTSFKLSRNKLVKPILSRNVNSGLNFNTVNADLSYQTNLNDLIKRDIDIPHTNMVPSAIRSRALGSAKRASNQTVFISSKNDHSALSNIEIKDAIRISHSPE